VFVPGKLLKPNLRFASKTGS